MLPVAYKHRTSSIAVLESWQDCDQTALVQWYIGVRKPESL